MRQKGKPHNSKQEDTMIQIDAATIRQLIIHRIGPEERQVVVSHHLTDYTDEEAVQVFKKILLKPFTSHSATFEFTHEMGLEYNVLFGLAKDLQEGEDFPGNSRRIVQHLASVSRHPAIKEGDLFIARFSDVAFDNQLYEALGIYKFEDKELFIETDRVNDEIEISFTKGLGSKKPDKACLILFTPEPYTLLIIDNNSGDTDYWQHDFIRHKPKNDSVNNTHDFLRLTKDFITRQIPQDFSVSKADQIDLLNRSVDYFKTHDQFNKNGFEEEVLHHDNMIQSFRKFDQHYRQDRDLEMADQFEISPQAVKKQARIFKSVLKLDRNFHIYIHGDRELIEQGIDENGKKFYKIYYEVES